MKNQPVETLSGGSNAPVTVRIISVKPRTGSFGLYVEILGILSRGSPVLETARGYRSSLRCRGFPAATYVKLDTEYAYENSSRLFSGSKHGRATHSDWVQLHATYQTAVIRLHSSAAYPTTRSPIFTPSYSASQRCLLAVENILSVTRWARPFAFTLWVSARLLLVHGSTIAHTVSPDIIFFVDTLCQLGKYWKVAERYSSILQRVLDEYNEYQQSTAIDGERSTPSTVKILADMRRCAFDLDFLISRQPRESPADNGIGESHQPHPPPASIPARNFAPNELEYLDVFGFFNVPRVPPARAPDLTTSTHLEIPDSVPNPMSIHGLTDASLAAPAGSVAVGGHSSNTNEFNITNYLIPTPETDWLFRPS
ncbi:Transcription factor [Penicillium robsamsonii]|uniref:Transcription factor n=1 Tax=Penicillium robsamsonii TaxID=1792511 RepID=UPI002549B552|nr:Transcription factor [Penicillium robsamsonii]KAJ5812691.1 Transcription factor [Penicillium robsamsonii]